MSKLGIMQMLRNFKEDIVAFAKAGAPHVSPESYEKRLSTCADCPHIKDIRCGMCGCIVEEKAKWATADCPDNRWDDEGEGDNTETSE